MQMASSPTRRTAVLFSILISAVLAAVLVAQPATAAKGGNGKGPKAATIAVDWAPADTATITPGVQTYTDGAQCTANFVFTDGAGKVYIGQAAHCAGTGGATETNGCDSGSLPLGTRVSLARGGSLVTEGEEVGQGTLVYSSWLTMQQRNETDENTCNYNDFALIQIDAADVANVNPSVPFWGGPVALDSDGTQAGESVYSYGNSSLRGGVEELSPKQGTSLGTDSEGWNHQVYTVTPGIPGDSGSAFLDAEGNALGTLSTVQLAPLAGSNGVSDLPRELAYAQDFGGFTGLTLATGTEPFSPIL
jgi:hypothetical protein